MKTTYMKNTVTAIAAIATAAAAITLNLAAPLPSYAQAGTGGKSADVAKARAVTLSGTLSCLGCDLKKAHGAGAQCSIYGHKHGLKTANGKYYTFLENQKSEPLVKGEALHGKPVQVTGTLFPGSQIIEVMSYKTLPVKKAGVDNGAKSVGAGQLVRLNVCPMMGSPIKGEGVGMSQVDDYEVHFCCAGCKPAFDKMTKTQQMEKVRAVLGKS